MIPFRECEISIMVVHDLPKVRARVRFPYLAPEVNFLISLGNKKRPRRYVIVEGVILRWIVLLAGNGPVLSLPHLPEEGRGKGDRLLVQNQAPAPAAR